MYVASSLLNVYELFTAIVQQSYNTYFIVYLKKDKWGNGLNM